MDAASFVVEMIDRVSGPSHKASKAVDDLNKQLKKTGTIGMKYTGAGPVPDVMKRINRQRLGTFAKSRIGAPLLGGVERVATNLTDGIMRFGKYAAIAFGAAGVAAGVFAVKSTVHMAMFAEKTRMAFGLLTGDKAIGEKTFTRTVELSRQLGLDVEDTAHSMQKLLAMQMNPAEAEKWIKLGSDLRAVGVEASAIQRVMLDIAHVKATGKLNMRNLNMFANAGVSSQLLMEEVGKAMGTDEKGAMAAMHAGKVTSAIALPALEKAIMRKTHEHEAGEAGAGFANKTLSGLLAQLQNAPKLFFMRMADKAAGAIERLKPLVDAIYKAIDNIQGDTFVRFISTALDMVTKMVPLALEFATGFGEGFSSIVDAMGLIDPAAASMKTAHDLGKSIATAFGVALEALGKIVKLVNWFDQHRNIAIFAASTLVGLRMLSGIAATIGALKTVVGVVGAGRLAAQVAAQAAAPVVASTLAGTVAPVAANAAGSLAGTAAGTSGAAALVAGISAWAGTSVAAASVAAISAAILPGLLALGAGIYWREEIAKWMLDPTKAANGQVAGHRGIDETDFPTTPTATLTGLQRAAANRQTNTNVELHTTVNIDGADKDAAQIGKDIGEHQRGALEQFFQSAALEQGAM